MIKIVAVGQMRRREVIFRDLSLTSCIDHKYIIDVMEYIQKDKSAARSNFQMLYSTYCDTNLHRRRKRGGGAGGQGGGEQAPPII